jgi:hypothetical protein
MTVAEKMFSASAIKTIEWIVCQIGATLLS